MKISSTRKYRNGQWKKRDFLLWLWVTATVKAVEKSAFLGHKSTGKMITGVPSQK
jgi:hypothetical protein